jgi:hypothetical protein
MAKDGKPSADDILEESKKDDRFAKMKGAGSALESDEEHEGTGDGETDHYDSAWEAMNGGDKEGWKEAMKKAHGK